jgi:hypothetical protein
MQRLQLLDLHVGNWGSTIVYVRPHRAQHHECAVDPHEGRNAIELVNIISLGQPGYFHKKNEKQLMKLDAINNECKSKRRP